MDSLDTPSVSLEIIIIALLIIINALLAMAETSVVTARKAKLEKQADSGDIRAQLALKLVEEPHKVLSTLQIGITLIGILIGTLTAVKLTPALAAVIHQIPLIDSYANSLALLVVVAAIMYLTLIFGELLPKTIARSRPEPIARSFARSINRLAKITAPFVRFLLKSTNFILFFIGFNVKKESLVTEDEVRTLIEQGTEEGTFEKTEQDMVDNVFRLGDQNAYALMTPRTQMTWIDLEDPLEKNLQIIRENEDTTFPVGRDSLDNFVGVLHTKDLLLDLLAGKKINIEKNIRTPMFIPKSMQAFKILETFKEANIHEAVVLDEFGGVIGFITIRDIVSEIVGDISIGQEDEEAQIIEREDGSWLIDGLLSIDDFKEHFHLDELPEEDEDHYQTMGGFITSYLDYIPSVSEKFHWNGLAFEIAAMDRARVGKIIVRRIVETNEANIA